MSTFIRFVLRYKSLRIKVKPTDYSPQNALISTRNVSGTVWRPSSSVGTRWGNSQRSPRPPNWIYGPTSEGGEGGVRKSRKERKKKGWKRKGKEEGKRGGEGRPRPFIKPLEALFKFEQFYCYGLLKSAALNKLTDTDSSTRKIEMTPDYIRFCTFEQRKSQKF